MFKLRKLVRHTGCIASLLMAMLFALGPIGAYQHELFHLLHAAELAGKSDAGRLQDGAGKVDRDHCPLFGAHSPLGSAVSATVPLLVFTPAASAGFVCTANVVIARTYVPFFQRGPPKNSLITA